MSECAHHWLYRLHVHGHRMRASRRCRDCDSLEAITVSQWREHVGRIAAERRRAMMEANDASA